jgi:peptidoglycan/xylan/chitin deacetylase (PgdA/CDA1 family)
MASMSRFAATTLLAVITALLLAASLRGFSRVGALLALAGVYVALFALGMSCIRLQFFCPAICRVERQPGRVALTFDDGPDPQATPALLDLLRREGVSATFFCIGKNVAAHPQLAARIAAEGHLLGNHLYSHFWWTSFLRRRGLVGEMMRTQQAIAAAAGVTPRYLRPPVGLTNPHFAGALRETGLTMVGWDVRTFDSARSTQTVLRRISGKTRDGSIIVLHDGGASPQILTEIVSAAITDLRSRGFSIERLDRMIESGGAFPQVKKRVKPDEMRTLS